MAGDICDVCGTSPTVGVACSGLGAVSFAYCAQCLAVGAEPYVMLVGLLMTCPWDALLPEYQEMVTENLKHLGKTREQLEADAAAAGKDYEDYCQRER